MLEVERLPSGKNWEWKETIIGNIEIKYQNDLPELLRIRNLDPNYITQQEINDLFECILMIQKNGVQWMIKESVNSETLLCKIYVCCLLGDSRFEDILNDFEKYLHFVPDGALGELQDSYLDYLENSVLVKK